MTDRQTDRHMDKIAISILCVRTPVLMHVKKSFFRNMPRAKFWKCKKDWSTCHKLPADINHTVNLAVNTDKSHLLMSDDGLDKLVRNPRPFLEQFKPGALPEPGNKQIIIIIITSSSFHGEQLSPWPDAILNGPVHVATLKWSKDCTDRGRVLRCEIKSV